MALSASWPRPKLPITRGEKLSATKSMCGTSALKVKTPAGSAKSNVTHRLWRLTELYIGLQFQAWHAVGTSRKRFGIGF